VHQLLVARPAFQSEPERLRDLAEARFVEDDLPAPTDWPQWRGRERDGVANVHGLLTDWPGRGPKVLWSAPLHQGDGCEGYSSFAVGGGRVFTLVREDASTETVLCWDARSGHEQWRQRYDCPAPKIQFGSGPRSTPCLDGDRLYTVGSSGVLHCLDVATGKPHWRHDLLAEFHALPPGWGVSSSPLVEGDLVLVNPGGTDGGSVAAFDKVTGELRWKALDDRASYSSPVAVTVAGQRQILFFTQPGLVSLTPEGRLLWRYPWTTFSDVNAATPLMFTAYTGERKQEYVFISSGYNTGCVLLRLEPDGAGGQRALRVYQGDQMCCHFSSPVRYRDHLYGFSESALTCMDLRTGAVKWRKNGYKKGSVILAEGHLIVLGEDGQLALLEATPAQGQEPPPVKARARPFHGDHCWAAPALADGLLYLRDREQVLCLDLRPAKEDK
jgi:outer membrane protein assembly factor BamB